MTYHQYNKPQAMGVVEVPDSEFFTVNHPLPVSGKDCEPLGGYARPPDVLDTHQLANASALVLDRVPVSAGATALTERVTAEVRRFEHAMGRKRGRGIKGLPKLTAAVGAFVGALLDRWGRDEPEAAFRSLKAEGFSGCLVGHTTFRAVLDGLTQLDLVRREDGIRYATFEVAFSEGKASRFWPTVKLLSLAAEYGVVPATVKTDFRRQINAAVPTVSRPVELNSLKARSGGDRVRLPLRDGDMDAQRIRQEVAAFNKFVAGYDVRGCRPPRWKRVFTQCWALGGRWYSVGAESTYQTMSEAERVAGITINGEPVAEVDVKSSHLSIMHGLLGLPLPEGDLYGFPGVPRPVIKAWITATLGKGTPVKRWPKRTPADVPEVESFPAIQISRMICKRYPFLSVPAEAVAKAAGLTELVEIEKPARLLTHRLMRIEAEALTGAMRVLRGGACHDGVPVLALPLHDSLIVPRSCAGAAETVLVDAFSIFANRVRIRCDITPPLQ